MREQGGYPEIMMGSNKEVSIDIDNPDIVNKVDKEPDKREGKMTDKSFNTRAGEFYLAEVINALPSVHIKVPEKLSYDHQERRLKERVVPHSETHQTVQGYFKKHPRGLYTHTPSWAEKSHRKVLRENGLVTELSKLQVFGIKLYDTLPRNFDTGPEGLVYFDSIHPWYDVFEGGQYNLVKNYNRQAIESAIDEETSGGRMSDFLNKKIKLFLQHLDELYDKELSRLEEARLPKERTAESADV